ncbi:MAG: SDR family oxidoreductase [Gammaproteobacteria bacterium]|nr:SDR family oxidoreductase [Gammaproteobacteria bacterium]
MKTALVTGGNSGMGEEITKDLLEKGLRVISIGLELPDFKHTNLIGLKQDLSSEKNINESAEAIKEYAPTVFIHNAGAIRAACLEDVSFSDLTILVNLHLGAAIFLAQACLPFMKKEGSGRIVLISSRAAVGLASRTVYTATKAGQIGMVRTWALELGPHGITVNAIAPGPISTPMFRDVIEEGGDKEQSLLQTLPMRRIGESGDIARAVNYFIDEENNFVTGQTLYVCGGASVGFLQI